LEKTISLSFTINKGEWKRKTKRKEESQPATPSTHFHEYDFRNIRKIYLLTFTSLSTIIELLLFFVEKEYYYFPALKVYGLRL
jgi:hypothetical protein